MCVALSRIPTFDPTQVPVLQVDYGLPKLPQSLLEVHRLRALLPRAIDWEPEMRREPLFVARPMAAAAVLIGLVERPQGLQVLLTERSARLNSHAGQIAFPGGKADAEDSDLVATALRETQEEVGLDRQWIEVLGQMPLYSTGSGFHVTPVVALIQPGFDLHPNPSEVASVFEVPLSFLMQPANHRHHLVEMQGVKRHWLSMPYRDGPVEHFIWGATAGMLRNLYRFLLDTSIND